MHNPFHCSPISLVPPTHWSPISLVPFSLVPQFISPNYIIWTHWSPFHLSPFSLIHPISANPNDPPSHWSPISLVPNWHPRTTHSIGPPSHCPPPSDINCPPPPPPPQLIGPPMQPWLYSSHWSPISLVPQSNPVYPVLIGSPSHWSPNVTLAVQFSLVPHLIGPPV